MVTELVILTLSLVGVGDALNALKECVEVDERGDDLTAVNEVAVSEGVGGHGAHEELLHVLHVHHVLLTHKA